MELKSYQTHVLASSNDFNATVTSVVEGLNGAGFSAADYRVAGAGGPTSVLAAEVGDADGGGAPSLPFADATRAEDGSPTQQQTERVPPDATGTALDELSAEAKLSQTTVTQLAEDAEKQGQAYDKALSQDEDPLSGLGVPMMKSYKIGL